MGLSGLGVIVLGINVGFGGIKTLGLQLPQNFITIVDEVTFATQDSHVRFLGGLFGAMGIFLVAGAFWTLKLRQTLIVICLIMAFGGVVRFSAGFAEVGLNSALYASLVFELFLFPVMAVLLWQFGRGVTGVHLRIAEVE